MKVKLTKTITNYFGSSFDDISGGAVGADATPTPAAGLTRPVTFCGAVETATPVPFPSALSTVMPG